MFKFVEFLKKRPSDFMIRILRVIGFGGLAALIIATHDQFSLPFAKYYIEYELIIKYVLAGFYIILAIVFGVLGLCVFKRSTMKKVQMILGLIFVFFGIYITNRVAPITPLNSQYISLAEYTTTPTNIPLPNASTLYIIIGLLTFVGGGTGKMITSSCIKYKEVIKKIRV